MDNIRDKVVKWLKITPAVQSAINITETLTLEGNVMKNLIWYRGDASELEQFYQQMSVLYSNYNFWSCRCSKGQEIRKVHTGLPALIVNTFASVVLADLNGFDFENQSDNLLWESISTENNIESIFEKSLKDVLVTGDGAFKISFDPDISDFPIIEFYSADKVSYNYSRGRLREIVFRTPYNYKNTEYILLETYGYGYIIYSLTKDGKEIPVDSIPETAGLNDVCFDDSLMLAVQFKISENSKFPGRGGSILDRKTDSFDSLDEIWSQWLDALRSGRSKQYIPEDLCPRDARTGEIMSPNPFDNRFIAVGRDMHENGRDTITVEQPEIRSDDYLAAYVTALDLCLQGLISPSTLGIDTKKLDNAEAQREKEKTTLYSRNAIVKAMQKILPELAQITINAYNLSVGSSAKSIKCSVTFGEYANPSFESQVETIGNARTKGIMSVERSVEELYGDTLTDEQKKQEIQLIKHEQGITEINEPMAADDYYV